MAFGVAGGNQWRYGRAFDGAVPAEEAIGLLSFS